MVVDVCLFNDEFDLWDIHYNALKGHVDQSIVCEATMTFSGKPKELLFPKEKYPNVRYYVIDDLDNEDRWVQAAYSPNTQGADHWKREFYIKESIKDALAHLKDDDLVIISDVDEVWDPAALDFALHEPLKLKLEVYTYFLNNRSTEEFWGPIVGEYRYIKGQCLNHLRTHAIKTPYPCGWHFTSMGGPVSLAKKLTDSYTQESYATPEVLANLEYNIEHGNDFLGRDFTYTIDESNWPKYLKENRDKYKHLMK